VDGLVVLRLLLVACCIVVAATTLALGERSSSLDELQAEIADGHVSRVEVSGILHPGSRGFTTQQVRWQRGPVGFVAEVVQRSPEGHVRPRSNPDLPVLREDVGTLLQRQHQDLSVTRSAVRHPGGSMGDWLMPGWVVALALVLGLLTLGLLMGGPEPRWATRWGWFWFVALAPPFGVPAYLILGRPRERVPVGTDKRVTGLPALVMATVLVPLAWLVLTLPF
jgi:hypothetical protein